MNTISTRASLIPGATNGAFRGRRLQVDNIPNRNSPSIDDQMDNIPSIDEPSSTNHETQPSTGQVHNSPSADDGGLPTSSKPTVIAPKARRCNTREGLNIVEFECSSVTNNTDSQIEDELKFQVVATNGDHLKIRVQYETESDTANIDTEIETQYTLVYNRLIEYRKVGDAEDDHYEWDIDEIVAQYPLNNWKELTALEVNGDQITFSATSGVATFIFTIAQTDLVDITTNKMKIDFLLEGYPWDPSGDTYVALVSSIETQRRTITEVEGTTPDKVSDVLIDFEDAVNTIGFVPFGEYTWAKTAEATFNVMDMIDTNRTEGIQRSETATIAVIASKSPESMNASASSTIEEIAFSFVGVGRGADRIFWDPEAGIGYADSSSAARLWGSIVLSAWAFSVGLVFLL